MHPWEWEEGCPFDSSALDAVTDLTTEDMSDLIANSYIDSA